MDFNDLLFDARALPKLLAVIGALRDVHSDPRDPRQQLSADRMPRAAQRSYEKQWDAVRAIEAAAHGVIARHPIGLGLR